jgi:hypothetical protein
MLASKILLVFAVGPCHVDRTLALDVTHHFRYRILGRDGKQHVHVVRHQVAFQNPALLLLGQTPKDLSQMLPKTFIQHSATTFGDKGYVIFALPYRVT